MTIRVSPTMTTVDEWATPYTGSLGLSHELNDDLTFGLSVHVTHARQADELLRHHLPPAAYQLVASAAYELKKFGVNAVRGYTDLKMVFRLSAVANEAVRRLVTSGLVQELTTVMEAFIDGADTITTKVRVLRDQGPSYPDTWNAPQAPYFSPDHIFGNGTLSNSTEPPPEFKATTHASTPAPDQLQKAREPETRFREWSASLKGR